MNNRQQCPRCGRFVSVANAMRSRGAVQFYDHGWYCNQNCLAEWLEANAPRRQQ